MTTIASLQARVAHAAAVRISAPSAAHIAAEIAQLREVKRRYPRFNLFRDNHHAAIDAQIRVLDEHMSMDDVDQHFGRYADLFDQYTWSCALLACEWLTGALDGDITQLPPSRNWPGWDDK